MNKICSKCQTSKKLCDFHKDSRGRFGVRAECKQCALLDKQKYHIANKKERNEKSRQWKITHPDYQKTYHAAHVEEIKTQRRLYYQSNGEFRQKRISSSKSYRSDPKNKPIINACKRKLEAKYSLNPLYRAVKSLRRRMNFVLHGQRKIERSLELVGCTPVELRQYLEAQFTIGMSWENYGQWHIDHIIPCSKFDFSNPIEQKQCFHYSNLQPLWAKITYRKEDNYSAT